MIDITCWISIAIIALFLGLIVLKIILDTIQYNRTQREKFCKKLILHGAQDQLIAAQLKIPVGKRALCKDCKLHKWFMEGVDGHVFIKETSLPTQPMPPGVIELDKNTIGL